MFISDKELDHQLDLCRQLENIDSTEEKVEEVMEEEVKPEEIDTSIEKLLALKDYLTLNENAVKLEVGKIYGIRLDGIRCVSIYTNEDLNSFNHYYELVPFTECASEVMTMANKLKDKYTLLKYLGYGEFEEFYTGDIIRLFEDSKINSRKFMEDYDKYRYNPLGVRRSHLIDFDSDIKNQIISNTNNEQEIIDYLVKYKAGAAKVLEEKYFGLADKDIDYAKTEDAIYDFRNKKVKKIIQI